MVVHLVKKDFLLIKKYILLIVVFSIGIPIFISKQATSIGVDGISILISEIFVSYMFYGSVSAYEQKTKGSILICTTPYTRRLFVEAKYLFVVSLYAIALLVYISISLLPFTALQPITLSSIGKSMFIVAVYFGITMPIEFKFGYDATRYITVIAIMSSTFLLPQFLKWIVLNNINLSMITYLPQIILDFVPHFLAIILWLISSIISIKIYSNKSF